MPQLTRYQWRVFPPDVAIALLLLLFQQVFGFFNLPAQFFYLCPQMFYFALFVLYFLFREGQRGASAMMKVRLLPEGGVIYDLHPVKTEAI